MGPGAHAFDGALTRRWNAARLDRYLAALLPTDGSPPQLPPGATETVDALTARAESVILALRLAEGVDVSDRFDTPLVDGLAWALANGLMSDRGARLSLTPRGRLLSNEVFARLLPEPAPARSEPG